MIDLDIPFYRVSAGLPCRELRLLRGVMGVYLLRRVDDYAPVYAGSSIEVGVRLQSHRYESSPQVGRLLASGVCLCADVWSVREGDLRDAEERVVDALSPPRNRAQRVWRPSRQHSSWPVKVDSAWDASEARFALSRVLDSKGAVNEVLGIEWKRFIDVRDGRVAPTPDEVEAISRLTGFPVCALRRWKESA